MRDTGGFDIRITISFKKSGVLNNGLLLSLQAQDVIPDSLAETPG